MGRYLVEAHLREGRSVAELAADHDVHRSWIYKLLARYRESGDAGLTARSRRPKTSPTRIETDIEDTVVLLRKQLAEEGLDAGALTIHYHLEHQGLRDVPSVSSIWRILKRRGSPQNDCISCALKLATRESSRPAPRSASSSRHSVALKRPFVRRS